MPPDQYAQDFKVMNGDVEQVFSNPLIATQVMEKPLEALEEGSPGVNALILLEGTTFKQGLISLKPQGHKKKEASQEQTILLTVLQAQDSSVVLITQGMRFDLSMYDMAVVPVGQAYELFNASQEVS